MAYEKKSLLRFWRPRYWSSWIVYAWMRTSVLLPLRWQIRIGRRAGRLLKTIAPRKRRIADQNLKVCFPELSDRERRKLCDLHFECLGASFPEMAMGWFGSERVVREAVHIEGKHYLKEALDRGKGVLLFCGHFTSLEFHHPALKPLCTKLTGMYRPMRNEMMNEIMCRGRGRNVDEFFSKYSVRGLLKSLSENAVVYYLTDQCYAGKYSALVPFFGEPAMTSTATSRILRMSDATLLTCFYRRKEDDTGYIAHIQPAASPIPTDDPVGDTAGLMKELEEFIRTCPEQYAWVHRRFKERPDPYPDIYASPEST